MPGHPQSATISYEIDTHDRIWRFNENWADFAVANDGAGLDQPGIIGRLLWDFVSDDATRSLYRQIVGRVRDGRSARFRLRCDGPDCRRLLEMTITGDSAGNVRFETVPLQIEYREPVALLSRRAQRSGDLLRVCAWCNRIHTDNGSGRWVEVEEAVTQLRLFEQPLFPQLTHGICEDCFARMTGTLELLKDPETQRNQDSRS